MNPVERTVIAATRAYGEAVGEIRPLELSEPGVRAPRARGLRTWMAPVTAGAAVIALAAALVIVRDIPNGRVVPPSREVSAAAMPAYYVALWNPGHWDVPDPVVVADIHTGKQLATVHPPAHYTFAGVTAAADDRTFVLDARQFPSSNPRTQVTPRSWYLLRIAQGTTHPALLSRLPIPATPDGARVNGIALSPDGSRLAVMFQPHAMGPAPGPVTLRIYSVATGSVLRTWTGPTPSPHGPGIANFDVDAYVDSDTTLSWQDGGRLLSFSYGPLIIKDTQVRMLDLARPGDSLLADSRIILDLKAGSEPDCTSLLLTADGRTIECGADAFAVRVDDNACAGLAQRQRPGFYEYSAMTGKLTRVLYLYRGTCVSALAEVLAASPSGGTMIGSLVITVKQGKTLSVSSRIGVISEGRFSPLSTPVPDAVFGEAIAW